jgi:hypothetical protein
MGQVIYFPLSAIKRHPSNEELQVREDMQAEINSYRWRVIYSEPDPYQRLIKQQEMQNMFTSKVELVDM